MGLSVLCGHRVALLNRRHHLAGCLVDVVFGIVLILVLQPAFVNAVAVARTNPFVALLTKAVSKSLQAFGLLGLKVLFGHDLDVDLLWLKVHGF